LLPLIHRLICLRSAGGGGGGAARTTLRVGGAPSECKKSLNGAPSEGREGRGGGGGGASRPVWDGQLQDVSHPAGCSSNQLPAASNCLETPDPRPTAAPGVDEGVKCAGGVSGEARVLLQVLLHHRRLLVLRTRGADRGADMGVGVGSGSWLGEGRRGCGWWPGHARIGENVM
jgi:hypothetical protein